MSQEYFRQANFTKGELSPSMIGRRDLKTYFFATASALNHLFSPEGWTGRRPGLAMVGRIRNPLTSISLGTATITAPNGGDVTGLTTADSMPMVTTTGLSTTDPYELARVDFGAAVTISCVDVIDYAVAPAGTAPGNITGNVTEPPTPVQTFPGNFTLGFIRFP